MRLLFVNGNDLEREGLKSAIAAQGLDWTVVEAASIAQASEIGEAPGAIAIVLLGVTTTGATGEHDLAAIRAEFPAAAAILFAAAEDQATIAAALSQGVRGYIPKSSSLPIVLNALRLVAGGGVYVPPIVYDSPVTLQSDLSETGQAGFAHDEKGQLTQRQRAVLGCIAEGLSNRGIAKRLGLSEGTVKIHVYNIFKALKVHNRVAATIAARRLGYRLTGDASPGWVS